MSPAFETVCPLPTEMFHRLKPAFPSWFPLAWQTAGHLTQFLSSGASVSTKTPQGSQS